MTNTKARHEEILNCAVSIIEEAGGVSLIDSLPQEERVPVLRSMTKRIKAETACHIDTAKRNLAKAMRRARHGLMKARETKSNWGGSRGGGRPKNTEGVNTMKAIVKKLFVSPPRRAEASYVPGHSKMVDLGHELVAAEIEFIEPTQIHSTSEYYGQSQRQPAKKTHVLAAKGMIHAKGDQHIIHVDELHGGGNDAGIQVQIDKKIKVALDDESRFLKFKSFEVQITL